MAELHETGYELPPVEGFIPASRLLARRTDDFAVSTGFKFGKVELPKMDLNGGIGGKSAQAFKVESKARLKELEHNSSGSLAQYVAHHAQRLNISGLEQETESPSHVSTEPMQEKSERGLNTVDQSCAANVPKLRGPRPALSLSQASALRMMPKEGFGEWDKTPCSSMPSEVIDVSTKTFSHRHSPNDPPSSPPQSLHTSSPVQEIQNHQSDTMKNEPEVTTFSEIGNSLRDSSFDDTRTPGPQVDLTADEHSSVSSFPQRKNVQYNDLERLGNSGGTDSTGEVPLISQPTTNNSNKHSSSVVQGHLDPSKSLRIPKVLSPRRDGNRVQKDPKSAVLVKPAVQTSKNKTLYHTSDIVKFLAKKLEEEQQDAANAAQDALENQQLEIERLNQLLKERNACLQTTASQLSDLQEETAHKTDVVNKIREKTARFSKFMTSIGSEMNILKNDHQELRRDHARLQLYAKDLETRSRKLQNETGNYQAAFRKYRSEMQEEMTEAGGQLKLLSLRHDDLEQQRDNNAAMLAEERDRSINLAQQLSKADDRLDSLHSNFDRSSDAIRGDLALLQSAVDRTKEHKDLSPDMARVLDMIGKLSEHKENSTREVQSLRAKLTTAAVTLSNRLLCIDECQKSQTEQIRALSTSSEQHFISLGNNYEDLQQSRANQHDLELTNLGLKKQLESTEFALAERCKQRDEGQARLIRQKDCIAQLQDEMQAMKDQLTANAQLADQLQSSKLECTELRARLIAAEQNLAVAQQNQNVSQASLREELTSLQSKLEISEGTARDLAEKCRGLVCSAQEQVSEARKQWLQDSQETTAKKQAELDNLNKQSTQERSRLQDTLQQHKVEIAALTAERDGLKANICVQESSLEILRGQVQAREQIETILRENLTSTESAKQRAETELPDLIKSAKTVSEATIQQQQADLQVLEKKVDQSQHALVQASERLDNAVKLHLEALEKSPPAYNEELRRLKDDLEATRSSIQERDDAACVKIQNTLDDLKKSEDSRTVLMLQIEAQNQKLNLLSTQAEQLSLARQDVHAQGTQTGILSDPASSNYAKLIISPTRITRKMVNRHNGIITLVDPDGINSDRSRHVIPAAPRQDLLQALQEQPVDSQSSRPQDKDTQPIKDIFSELDIVNPSILSMMDYNEDQAQSECENDFALVKKTCLESSVLRVPTTATQDGAPSENKSQEASSSPLSEISPQTPGRSVDSHTLRDLSTNVQTSVSTRKAGSLKRPANTKISDSEGAQQSRHFTARQPNRLSNMTLSQDSQADDLNLTEDGSGFGIPGGNRKMKNKYNTDHDAEESLRNSHKTEQHGSSTLARPVKSSLKRKSAPERATAWPRQLKKQKQVSHAEGPTVHASRPISNGSQGSSQHSVTETHSVSITTSSRVRSFTSPNARQPPARSSNQRRSNLGTGASTGRKATRASAPFNR